MFCHVCIHQDYNCLRLQRWILKNRIQENAILVAFNNNLSSNNGPKKRYSVWKNGMNLSISYLNAPCLPPESRKGTYFKSTRIFGMTVKHLSKV